MESVRTDVLVIGNGGAGSRAAIEAHSAGARVLVMARNVRGKAHTVMAEGGLNAAFGILDPTDSIEFHIEDTIREGAYLNNQELVEILCSEACARVADLERFGAVFSRDREGRIAQRPFGGQRHPRTCYAGDETGHEMMMACLEEMRRREIPFRDETIVTALLFARGRGGMRRVAGVLALDMKTGGLFAIQAGAVVLATGGAGRLWSITSNARECTGSGTAMAYEAGAELIDMEQVQFHPTGMVHPPSARGILVTEAVRGEGGILTNAAGERFMLRASPDMKELAPRDVVARAIWREIEDGRGTKRGGVWLGVTHLDPARIEKVLPRMVSQFRDFAHVDIRREPMEVAPTCHHFMGGVRVRPADCRSTTVEGLFVAGEAMGGVHGGNRLGGNALAETQVFGARAGRGAAVYAKEAEAAGLDAAELEAERERVEAPLRRKDGVRPARIRVALQDAMWRWAGIVRTEDGLSRALAEIERLRALTAGVGAGGDRAYNHEWYEAIDLSNRLVVAEAVVRSALARKESRGAHYREDYPAIDPAGGLVNTRVRRDASEMALDTLPVVAGRVGFPSPSPEPERSEGRG